MRPETASALFSMSQAADRIAEVTFGANLERLRALWVMQSAVERQFEIMGEALAWIRILEEPIYDRIPDGAKIVGLRNVIIDGYDIVAIRHQIQALDAGMLLTEGGRQQFISSLERASYETLLNILAVRWLSGTVRTVTYSPGYNARRFLALRNISTARMIKEGGDFAKLLVNLGIPANEAEKRQRLLLRRARASMKQYGFDMKTTSWFHANGVTGMFERLWPDGGQPKFPSQLFPLDGGRPTWVEWFTHCWKANSNQVHANIAGLTSSQFDARGKWPSVDRIVNYVNLSRLRSVCFLGVSSAARALDRLPAYNAIVEICENEPYNHN